MSLVSGYPAASYGPTDAFCASGFYPPNHPSSTVPGSDYNNQQQHFYSSTWAWNPQSMAQNPADFNNCYNSSCNSSPCHYGVDYTMTGPSSSSGSAGSIEYSSITEPTQGGYGVPRIRVVKRRTTANKKERRRTQSINNAFTELRDCIPNVPADTKLSKIKTLRLATSYISYLMSVLDAGDADVPFRAELGRPSKSEQQQRVAAEQMASEMTIHQNHYKEKVKEEVQVHSTASSSSAEKRKGRTGWPHHVWALELKP